MRRTASQLGHCRSTGAPPGPESTGRGELVDGIPSLGAEQLGEREIVRGQEMNDKVAGVQWPTR